MRLFINDLKKDLYELKSILGKLNDDNEILVIQKQIDLLNQIINDLKDFGECIIEER